MTRWSYHHPTRSIFGAGVIADLAGHAPNARLALVTSAGFQRRGLVERVQRAMDGRICAVIADVEPNPDIQAIEQQLERLRPARPEALIALGGGSSIDTAKALARMSTQTEVTLTAHFRDGVPLDPVAALPVLAVPTTAGTGAEVTPFGTVWDFQLGRKYSISGSDLYPMIALVDPELTYDLPRDVTVASGLDALSHALESIWNRNANPITVGHATQALQLGFPALGALAVDLGDRKARSDMMQASLLAGLAISQTRTALAHSISYPLTTACNLPHGIACSFTLPALLRFNAAVDDGRLAALVRALGYQDVDSLAEALRSLLEKVGTASLMRRHFPDPRDMLDMTAAMVSPDRAGNNLRTATPADIHDIVRESVELLQKMRV
jgi:alcohol dehydrogenase